MDFTQEYDAARLAIETQLNTYFNGDCPQKLLCDAMRYSLLAGGKRIRPVLTVKFAEACGRPMPEVLPLACGVEMLHTYSLIHDDLPCMDDDDLRRGRPTSHVVYGEATAVLAGDALQAAAFEVILSSKLPSGIVVAAAYELARAAGENGICGGQVLDILGEGKKLDIQGVSYIHEKKTAAMIRAAVRIGVLAGCGTESQLAAATEYADYIGLAFQIRDDVLDMTSTTEELGKPVGSDAENDKTTFATLLGIDQCERIIREKTDAAKAALQGHFTDPSFFCALAEKLAARKK
jgi:geranylgeranyl diphosphate synthase type II